jgi:O-antigen ligase
MMEAEITDKRSGFGMTMPPQMAVQTRAPFHPTERSLDPDFNSQGFSLKALSLRHMTVELWVILVYTIIVGVGDLRAAKLGIQIGPLPVFLTDISLLMLLLVSIVRWPSRILFWLSAGAEAGVVGRLAWILCIVAAIYFALAVPEYHLYAARDFAIFGYSLFFPLTYFAIRYREDAVRLLRYFTYAGVLLSIMVLLEVSGVHLGLLTGGERIVLGRRILAVGAQDASAFSVFSLAALLGYAVFDRRLRNLHMVLAAVCFLALAASTSRAAVVAIGLVSCLTLAYAGPRYRIRAALLVAVVFLLVFFSPLLSANRPGVKLLQDLRMSIVSAASGPTVDPTSQFRLVRWHHATTLWMQHPIFGVGFGRPIIPSGLVDSGERQGQFNAGMPHNTFLFLGARTGFLGLGIVLLCWCVTLSRLLRTFPRMHRPDDLAALNILLAMFAFATFVLFFERPVTNAAFWIVLAIANRLAEFANFDLSQSSHPVTYAFNPYRA